MSMLRRDRVSCPAQSIRVLKFRGKKASPSALGRIRRVALSQTRLGWPYELMSSLI